MRGLSLVAASGGHFSSWCAGLSLSRPLLLRRTGSRRAGSVVVAHGPSCSAACGILPDQGSNPCPLHWQADSQPLRHQGSPLCKVLKPTIVHSQQSGAPEGPGSRTLLSPEPGPQPPLNELAHRWACLHHGKQGECEERGQLLMPETLTHHHFAAQGQAPRGGATVATPGRRLLELPCGSLITSTLLL